MAGRPDGDVWNIVDNDKDSQHYGRNFRLNFSYISSEEIKDVVKDYVWQNYRVGNKVLKRLYDEVQNHFKWFSMFADANRVTSLKGLDNVCVDSFVSFLRTTISPKIKKTLAYTSQKIALDTLKSVIRWCQLHRPNDVPVTEIFTGNEYVGVNRKLKIDFIPDDVVAQINEALKKEENPYLKYGIIILQSTGMRIGDLLKLRIDCIKPHLISGYTIEWTQHKGRKDKVPMPVRSECVAAIEKLVEITSELRDEADEKDKDGYDYMEVTLGKTEKGEPIIHKVFINELVKDSIAELSEYTAGLRKESGLKELFVSRSCRDKKIHIFTKDNWNYFKLNKFIKRHDIRDNKGALYPLKSHQFRATFVREG